MSTPKVTKAQLISRLSHLDSDLSFNDARLETAYFQDLKPGASWGDALKSQASELTEIARDFSQLLPSDHFGQVLADDAAAIEKQAAKRKSTPWLFGVDDSEVLRPAKKHVLEAIDILVEVIDKGT